MNSPCSQILLKSTSSISLNERFTMMLQSQQVPLTDIRDTMPQKLTASLKNQRLVQQMANRPSVLAALQNKLSPRDPEAIQKAVGWMSETEEMTISDNETRKIKLHNIQSSSVKQHQFKGSVKTRLGRPMMRGGLHEMSRSWGRPRGRGILLRGALSDRCQSLIQQQQGPYINRGGLTQSKGLRGALRGKGRAMLFEGRGSAGRSARPDCRPLPTREELDAELDEYMSMTKSQLDAQLDAYMAEVDPEDLL